MSAMFSMTKTLNIFNLVVKLAFLGSLSLFTPIFSINNATQVTKSIVSEIILNEFIDLASISDEIMHF
jgi:hypothetical protein